MFSVCTAKFANGFSHNHHNSSDRGYQYFRRRTSIRRKGRKLMLQLVAALSVTAASTTRTTWKAAAGLLPNDGRNLGFIPGVTLRYGVVW